MRSSQIADDVRLSLQLSSPGNEKKSSRKLMRAFTNFLKSLPSKLISTSMESVVNKEDARSVSECQSGDCGLSNESRERFALVLLMMSSFLLSFATAGALYFTQALAIVGSHDPLLKDSLAALNRVVSASFFCNFLGLFALLILQSRREYHRYMKLSLTISNTASFLFLVLGYGFIIAFNIQRR
ncbi:hypothetical protein MKX03_034282 [Papaver bracteatum]|nr:hypothetical protein MKX03_034282 [Papaver bracteatum]